MDAGIPHFNDDQQKLLKMWLSGNISRQDWEQLLDSLKDTNFEEHPDLGVLLRDEWNNVPETQVIPDWENKLDNILAIDRRYKPKTRLRSIQRTRRFRRWGIAAVIILLFGISGPYFIRLYNSKATHTATSLAVMPGTSGAILTLSNGRKVVLDSAGNGVIATENGVRILFNKGKLEYEVGQTYTGEALYNTMATPKGRQFELTLPDGTRVWLNSASSIRYPIVFASDTRHVAVTGEVFLDVAKDKRKPFSINVSEKNKVDVLGTQLNINAYKDEPDITTTLLEGSVKVQGIILKPGQQAQMKQTGNVQLLENVDLDRVMAWKNGLFNFNGTDLQSAMRQLERWYNITVKYPNGVPSVKLFGEISKGVRLQELLKMLNAAELDCTIEADNILLISGKK